MITQKRLGMWELPEKDKREWRYGSWKRVLVDVLVFATAVYLAIAWVIATRG